MKKEELENYVPKGQLKGFPKEIIARMLECQEEQGNERDVTVFEKSKFYPLEVGGFAWNRTKEKDVFWYEVICNKDFDLFFEKYPKQDNQYNSQEFKVGDKVYDIMCKSSGIITNVSIGKIEYPLTVELENGKIINTYTIDGILNSYFKTPQLLHYRDDYNYSVIDFNNLPKRQEPKRWRAEEGGYYYYFIRDECDFNLDKIYKSLDYYNHFSNDQYKIGNYFQTKEEAQEVADKLKEYFKQLINTRNDTHRN